MKLSWQNATMIKPNNFYAQLHYNFITIIPQNESTQIE